MAVEPSWQPQGIGSYLIEEALEVARTWPSDSIRLDAFDAEAGAGGFYAKCGFREVARAVYKGDPLIYFERIL
jgi:GNAT superfamily N-acetyltransferase